MTALVGILNKRAAVMAADSAITVTNKKSGRRITLVRNFSASQTIRLG